MTTSLGPPHNMNAYGAQHEGIGPYGRAFVADLEGFRGRQNHNNAHLLQLANFAVNSASALHAQIAPLKGRIGQTEARIGQAETTRNNLNPQFVEQKGKIKDLTARANELFSLLTDVEKKAGQQSSDQERFKEEIAILESNGNGQNERLNALALKQKEQNGATQQEQANLSNDLTDIEGSIVQFNGENQAVMERLALLRDEQNRRQQEAATHSKQLTERIVEAHIKKEVKKQVEFAVQEALKQFKLSTDLPQDRFFDTDSEPEG